jgi:membrane-associated phospholipid phosphatase
VALAGVASGPRADAALASVTWQATARALVASHPTFTPLTSNRAYALHAMAQYGAIVAADFGGGRAQFEVRRGAVAGASAQILGFIFPTARTTLEQQLAAQGADGPGGVHPQFTRGVAIGRAMAERMKQWAAADGFARAWNGVPLPTGPGLWVGVPNVAPAGFQLAAATPYFLTSTAQFRPLPPPEYGTAAFAAAVAAVRAVTDARGQRETDIANFWNQGPGTPSTGGFWLAQASSYIVDEGLDEREAARIFALAATAMFDASLGCFEAKYHYQLLRPSQADPGITRAQGTPTAPYGLPNHPAYPSGHSCISAAGAAVIADRFPAHAAELELMVAEAGMSRIYGGLHYFFDVAAGQELGRAVAAWAIAYDDARGVLAAVPGLGVAP